MAQEDSGTVGRELPVKEIGDECEAEDVDEDLIADLKVTCKEALLQSCPGALSPFAHGQLEDSGWLAEWYTENICRAGHARDGAA